MLKKFKKYANSIAINRCLLYSFSLLYFIYITLFTLFIHFFQVEKLFDFALFSYKNRISFFSN